MAKSASQTEAPPASEEKSKEPGTHLAPIIGGNTLTLAGQKYTIKKRVNTTTLTLDVDSEAAFKANRDRITIVARILEPIREGKALQNAKYPTPAKIMLLEADNGQQGQLVVSHILANELNREYPDDGYLGKWFMLTKFRKSPDKRYNKFEIIEIEAPTGEVSAAAA